MRSAISDDQETRRSEVPSQREAYTPDSPNHIASFLQRMTGLRGVSIRKPCVRHQVVIEWPFRPLLCTGSGKEQGI